ncbi:hypothetical protein ACTFIV_001993 [Dictyostelium citrinum]
MNIKELFKVKKINYHQLPEPNEVTQLINNIKELSESNDNIIKIASRKFMICVPTEFCRVLLLSSMSKKSILKHYLEKIQRLVELFILFFNLVSEFNREATEISKDTYFENADLGVKSIVYEMENIHSQMIQLANQIVEDIETTIYDCEKGHKRISPNHRKNSIPLKSVPDGSSSSSITSNTPLLKSSISNDHIQSLTKCLINQNLHAPSIKKLIDKNNLKQKLLNSGGIFFLVISCVTVVVGVVLAPFTAGTSLLTALASIFMIAGGTFSFIGGVLVEVLGNKFFIEKDLDLLKSLNTLKLIKGDIENMLNSFNNNSQLADQLSKNFHNFKMGEYGSLGILCDICGEILKNPLYFQDREKETEKKYCSECISNYYKSQQISVGSENDDDLFVLPNSSQLFNLKTLQPGCEMLNNIIKNAKERYDEWERKLLSMIGNNRIC